MYVNKEIYEKYPSIREAFREQPVTRLKSENEGTGIVQIVNLEKKSLFSGGFFEMHCKEKFNIHY